MPEPEHEHSWELYRQSWSRDYADRLEYHCNCGAQWIVEIDTTDGQWTRDEIVPPPEKKDARASS